MSNPFIHKRTGKKIPIKKCKELIWDKFREHHLCNSGTATHEDSPRSKDVAYDLATLLGCQAWTYEGLKMLMRLVIGIVDKVRMEPGTTGSKPARKDQETFDCSGMDHPTPDCCWNPNCTYKPAKGGAS